MLLRSGKSYQIQQEVGQDKGKAMNYNLSIEQTARIILATVDYNSINW